MTLQDAQQAMRDKIPVVAKYSNHYVVAVKGLLDVPGYIEEVDEANVFSVSFVKIHGWWWLLENIEFADEKTTDPNPALTEALEAISSIRFPVFYHDVDETIHDNNFRRICQITAPGTKEFRAALGHLIAGMLNEVKRK